MGQKPSPTLAVHDHPKASREIAAVRLIEEIGVGSDSLALAVLEQSDDCIKILSRDGELDYMNCGGVSAMQLTDFNAVSGKLWWELWPEESRRMVRQMFQRSLTGREVEFEATCPTAQGLPKRWSVKLKPMLTPDFRVTGVLCTSREISHEDVADDQSPPA